MSAEKRVIILGGGIGGLETATLLGRQRNISVTLIDHKPVHIWKPSLHEFASGTISHNGNLFSFIELSKRFGFDFIQSSLEDVDRENKTLTLQNGQQLPYDQLVVSIGARANDFGTPGAQEHCLFLNTLDDAGTIHDRFRTALKEAQETGTPLTLSIVGGGATGVQLAAELCKAIDTTPGLGSEARKRLLKPTLVEAAPRLLPAFPESVSEETKTQLEEIGFTVITNGMVSEITSEHLALKDGRTIPASIRIWAAGVQAGQATSFFKDLEQSRSGQILVNSTLQATQDQSIFAIGDCARMVSDPVAPTAQAARQQGRYLGRIAIPHLLSGKSVPPFHYTDRGAVVALGKYNAWGMWPSKEGFGGRGLGALFARFIHEGLFRQHQMELSGLYHTTREVLKARLSPNNPGLNDQKK